MGLHQSTKNGKIGGGKQGFQTPIMDESFVIEGFGVLGAMHQERSKSETVSFLSRCNSHSYI
jgi:hypothetical protein